MDCIWPIRITECFTRQCNYLNLIYWINTKWNTIHEEKGSRYIWLKLLNRSSNVLTDILKYLKCGSGSERHIFLTMLFWYCQCCLNTSKSKVASVSPHATSLLAHTDILLGLIISEEMPFCECDNHSIMYSPFKLKHLIVNWALRYSLAPHISRCLVIDRFQ